MKPTTPLVTAEFRSLVRRACEYTTARQDELKDMYGLSDFERYDWDQDEGTIVFSSGGVPGLLARIHFVGSVSAKTGTWLWAWANTSLSDKVTERIHEVRKYGQRHRLAPLVEHYWSADEMGGWEMTSVSAYLLKAQGAYRSPSDTGFTFMVLTDVRRPSR